MQPRPKAVLFDVNQTLFSLEPVRNLAEPHQPELQTCCLSAICCLVACYIKHVHRIWQPAVHLECLWVHCKMGVAPVR